MNSYNISFIASGPVIIENGKVLLNREYKENGISPWMFPGGRVEDYEKTLEDACKREVNEEMGIDVEIIKPLRPILVKKEDTVFILIHYLAKRIGEIKPGKEIADWGWHDINNLPENCTDNVYQIIRDLK
ncbi:MAG: NUDIX domain-containing protein [Candidatus Magasanikbacteria bacterium]|nr:NUDIX domain-containing protein [Candidatus Magasanikbacteria bacterium]